MSKLGVIKLAIGAVLAAATMTSVGPAWATPSITLYTSVGLEPFYKAVLPRFEKAMGMRVNIVSNSSGANLNRMEIDRDSPKADVFVSSPPFTQQAVARGFLTPYRTAADASISAGLKDPHAYWTTFMDNYFGFIYNPTLSKAPDTYDDLLKPEYRGLVSYGNPATSADGMDVIILLDQLWGEDKAFDFLTRLEPSIKFHPASTGSLDVLVGRGEIRVANGDLRTNLNSKFNAGLAVEPFFLRPAPGVKPVTFRIPYSVGLVKDDPNPAGGKALIDYLLSKEVQARIIDVLGLPVRNDVKPTGQNVKVILDMVREVEIIPVDWNRVIDKQPGWEKRWRSQVVGGSGKALDSPVQK